MRQFASGRKSWGICDRCGQRYRLRDLKKLIINRVEVNTKVCPECWEPDHPQNELGRFPVFDPQALRDPRPDPSDEASRELTVPGGGTVEDYIASRLYK